MVSAGVESGCGVMANRSWGYKASEMVYERFLERIATTGQILLPELNMSEDGMTGAGLDELRLQAENARLKSALVDIFHVTLELTVQSTLSASGPGERISKIVFDALGEDTLRELLRLRREEKKGE